MEFSNSYEDSQRAESYSKLEFPGTYYLAYRDLPDIIRRHTRGKTALDFGCGTGRSTRFLQRLGFTATGVDISQAMIDKARQFDPTGDYQLIGDGDLKSLGRNTYDLVLSVFTFDNIPSMSKRTGLFRDLGNLLSPEGTIVCLDSTPELYVNEWASFSTRPFTENRTAKSGDIVRTIMNDVEDRRPVEDVFWTDDDYRETFKRAGLDMVASYRPLGKPDEPYAWVSETTIAPWVIYVLKRARV
jgi:SAM-dependent methyltransferase